MSYVVHIVKMNNFNLQPPPPLARVQTRFSPLSSIFFVFEGRVIL